MEKYPERKDATDGELCLEKAVKLGAKSILIIGGHGGRTGMLLANLKVLRKAHDLGLESTMVGKGESIRYISPGGQLSLAGRSGATMNLLSVDGDAVVSLKGTAFDGDEMLLARKSARGVSNKIVADGATITVRSGTVLCIIERKKQSIMMV
jgi:thiamine pyrophosphokinase